MAEPIAGVGYLAGLCGHDGTDWLKVLVDADGKLIIEVDTSVLPSGAATSAHQLTMITALQSLQNLVGALHDVGLDELDIRFAGQAVDVEVKQQTPADLVVAQHQYDGSAWRKSNLLWGYNGVVSEEVDDANLSAGNQNLTGATVPSGEVWVITSLSIYFASASIDQIVIGQSVDGNVTMLYANGSPTTTTWYSQTGQFVLGPGDHVYGRFYTCTAGDDGNFRYAGYKMDIAM